MVYQKAQGNICTSALKVQPKSVLKSETLFFTTLAYNQSPNDLSSNFKNDDQDDFLDSEVNHEGNLQLKHSDDVYAEEK